MLCASALVCECIRDRMITKKLAVFRVLPLEKRREEEEEEEEGNSIEEQTIDGVSSENRRTKA